MAGGCRHNHRGGVGGVSSPSRQRSILRAWAVRERVLLRAVSTGHSLLSGRSHHHRPLHQLLKSYGCRYQLHSVLRKVALSGCYMVSLDGCVRCRGHQLMLAVLQCNSNLGRGQQHVHKLWSVVPPAHQRTDNSGLLVQRRHSPERPVVSGLRPHEHHCSDVCWRIPRRIQSSLWWLALGRRHALCSV